MIKKIMAKSISLVCMIMFMLSFISIGVIADTGKAVYEPTKSPIINYFKNDKSKIQSGETVTLSWGVTGAKSVKITGDEKDLECGLEDSVEVWPMVTTEYTLHAYGFSGEEVTQKLLVTVGTGVQGAVINSFTASPSQINSGQSSTLSWQVSNATNVTINGKKYNSEGSIIVSPTATTNYTISATGSDGITITKQVTVKVISVLPPNILSFTADKTVINAGDTVNLSWNVLNAVSVKIVGIEKEIEEGNSVEVWPMATTTYTLIATGADGSQVQKSLTVVVKPVSQKMINSFTASSTNVSKGEMVQLSWKTTNAVKCSIETSSGQKLKSVPVNGSVSVTPNKTITYTLVATDVNGNEERQSITVTVVK